MFELPDDDDNFWEDLPLEDVTNTKSPKQKISSRNVDQCGSHIGGTPTIVSTSFSVNLGKLTENPSFCEGPGKNVYPPGHRNHTITSFGPSCVNTLRGEPADGEHGTSEQSESCAGDQIKLSGNEQFRSHELVLGEIRAGKRLSSESNLDASKKIRLCEEQGAKEMYGDDQSGNSLPRAPTDRQLGQTPTPQSKSDEPPHHNNASNFRSQLMGTARRPNSGQERGQTTTPVIKKARRKFPGPAGLLPRLSGNNENSREAVTSSLKTSPEQLSVEKEDVILSSQSADDVFCEEPWRMLMEELGADGQQLLPNFSIASNLNKARKKQLHRGKVPLLLCVIDTIDWHGCDLSVSLKDRSGKIQGTIHRDIMKEFESELQVGSALVLRQVSVISPNPRSHYLNITPANIVFIYSKNGDSCKQINTRNASLSSVLEEVQREEASERLQMNRSTVRTPNRDLNHVPHRAPQFGTKPSTGAAPVFDKSPQNSRSRSFTSNNQQVFNRTPQNYGRLPALTTRTPLGVQNRSVNSRVSTTDLRTQTSVPICPTGAPSIRTPVHQGVPSLSNKLVSAGTPPSVSSSLNSSVGQNQTERCMNPPGENSLGSSARVGSVHKRTSISTPSITSQANVQETNKNYQTPPNRRAFKFKPTRTPEIPIVSNNNTKNSTTSTQSVDRCVKLDTSSDAKSKQGVNPRFVVDWGEDLSDDVLSQLSEEF